MATRANPLTSTIGLKILMALTGLALLGFVLIHMLGNLQIFLPPAAINIYAHKLQTLPVPVLWGFRLGLLAMVAVHIWAAIKLTRLNRAARPINYDQVKPNQATLASRSMVVSGLIVLAFILFHLWQFTIRGAPFTTYNQMETTVYSGGIPEIVQDVYRRVVTGFQNPWISGFYVVAVGLLCLHLSHGTQSLFRTLGLATRQTFLWQKIIAHTFALIIFLGMAAVPISVLLGFIK